MDYLTELNPQQRRAVTYGIRPGNARKAGPFLVIAAPVPARPRLLPIARRICLRIELTRIAFCCSRLRVVRLKG